MAVVAKLDILTTVNTAPLTAGFQKGANAAKTFSSSVAGSMKRLGGSFLNLRNMLGGLLAYFSVRAITRFIGGELQAMDATTKMARSFNMSTKALTGIEHAAKLSDVELQSLQSAFARMNDAAVEATKGMKDQKEAFEYLGLSASDVAKMDSSEMFLTIAESVHKTGLSAQTTSALMGVFGRSAAKIIPMFEGGRKALQGYMADADKLGISFDEVTGRQVEAANDAFTRFKGALSGVGRTIAIEVAPMMEALGTSLADATAEAMKGSTAMQQATNYIAHFAAVLADIGSGIYLIFKTVQLSLMGLAAAVAHVGLLFEKLWNVIVPDSMESGFFDEFAANMRQVVRDVADDIQSTFKDGSWGNQLLKRVEGAKNRSLAAARQAEKNKTKTARWQEPITTSGGGVGKTIQPAAAMERGSMDAIRAILAEQRRRMGIDKTVDLAKQQLKALAKIEENTRKPGVQLAGAEI